MGYEKLGRTYHYRLTCDNCGKVENVDTNSSEESYPAPWVGFFLPQKFFQPNDREVVTCGRQCALALSSAEIDALSEVAQ